MAFQRRVNSIAIVVFTAVLLSTSNTAFADAAADLRQAIETRTQQIEPKLIALQRDFHAHPELGNRELRTAGIIAKQLRALGLEVRTGIARTGIVGVLKGGLPGPVVALRSDMDALPGEEKTGLPFASRDRGNYRGTEGFVMHACGHDGHMAILLSVAEVLAGLRAKLPGTVVVLFQPAEEGPSDFEPDGKRSWGAKLMVQEGVLQSPRPNAVFALHLRGGLATGHLAFRSGATMASSDDLYIRITGKQTHAGRPWDGIDPIVVSAQAILGLQTVISRQTDLTATPTVISIGTIHGGTRYNIVPEFVDMEGTIRAYDEQIRRATQQRVRRTVENIAQSASATAQVRIIEKYDPTINDAALVERSVLSLRWAARDKVVPANLEGGAEDFSFFA